MKKKLLAMLVAAVMVATLFPTALADMPSNEEAWSYISLQMAQPDDLDHYVQNPVTLYDDFDPEFANSIFGYDAYERNTTWELKNTAKEGDNCYIRLDLNIYRNQDGRYAADGPWTACYLAYEGFARTYYSPDSAGGLVMLKPGESVTFSLSNFENNYPGALYGLKVTLYYPDYDRSWWSSYVFQLDDEAVARMRQEQTGANTPSFTDVPDWCFTAVNWAVDEGVTNGTGDGKFSPNDTCKDVEILTMLWRAAGKPAAKGASPFTVAAWYQDAVDWAYGEGLIDDDAIPDAHCTRANALSYIWQVFGSPSAEGGSFTDVSADANYAAAVTWGVANGITNGYGDTFRPGNTCTRAEIVTFLHRAYVEDARLK